MKFRLNKGSEWKPTTAVCKRDGELIYQEVLHNGTPIDNFTCNRNGCTWPDYDTNVKDIKIQIANNEMVR